MRLFGISLAIALACSASMPSFAADKDFDLFWAKFKTAIQKNNKADVSAMTKLPYLLNDKNLNKQQFIQKYDQIFTPSVRRCMQKEKPVADKDCYMVFCGEEIFIFAKVNGKYMFTEIGVND